MFKRSTTSFVAGFATAALLFGGAAMAADWYQQTISVTYLPLRYSIDGTERTPPADQKGFIYQGRTYVPLRFLGEALGKKVDYDADTTTIYVGRRPAALPALWEQARGQGGAAFKLQYFPEGATTIRGSEMAQSVLVSAIAPGSQDPGQANAKTELWVDIDLPAGATTIEGSLFVPDLYMGAKTERKVGRLAIFNESNQALYSGPDLTTNAGEVPFHLKVQTEKRVKLVITLFPNQGVPTNDTLVTAQIGVAGLTIK